jgi:hypothetical protein
MIIVGCLIGSIVLGIFGLITIVIIAAIIAGIL